MSTKHYPNDTCFQQVFVKRTKPPGKSGIVGFIRIDMKEQTLDNRFFASDMYNRIVNL